MTTINIDGHPVTIASATERGRVVLRYSEDAAVSMIHLSNEPMYWYDGAWQAYSKADKLAAAGTIATLDNSSHRTLEQMVSIHGIRPVLFVLEAIAEKCAEVSVENFNTVQAKQWASWAVELEAMCGSSKLKDPGRE